MAILKEVVAVLCPKIPGVLWGATFILNILKLVRPVVFSPKTQTLRELLLDLKLKLMEVGCSRGRVVIDAAPGLQGPLLLEGYVRLLHRGYVNVSPVEQQVMALRTQVTGAKRPALADLPFGGKVPLLRYLTGKVAVHHTQGRVRRDARG